MWNFLFWDFEINNWNEESSFFVLKFYHKQLAAIKELFKYKEQKHNLFYFACSIWIVLSFGSTLGRGASIVRTPLSANVDFKSSDFTSSGNV